MTLERALSPTISFDVLVDQTETPITVKLAKSWLQQPSKVLRNAAANAARAVERDELTSDHVKSAVVLCENLEAIESMITAADDHAGELQAAIDILRGRKWLARHASSDLVQCALSLKSGVDAMREIEPEASILDISEITASLESTLHNLLDDISTAKSRTDAAEQEVRRMNGATLAAIQTKEDTTRFGDAKLHTLLPDHWPSELSKFPSAKMIDAARMLADDTISERNAKLASKKRTDDRTKQATFRSVRQKRADAKENANSDLVATITGLTA